MNSLLLKYYLKTGNSSKIRELSDKEYEKFYGKLSFVDRIKLSHLRGVLVSGLDNFDLTINGRSLYEILDDKNSLMFYLELLDYINCDVLYNGEYVKRFNIPLWKNKLEESGYLEFGSNDIYNLIIKNTELFINLLESDKKFRELFFRNVSFEGNLYELGIGRILSCKEISAYLAKQQEMSKFYNKKYSSIFNNLDVSFFENLPDDYKFLIGYYGSGLIQKNTDKVKGVLKSYFPFLPDGDISDIVLLYNSSVSNENIASLISLIIADNNFYSKYKFLCDNYFDGDFDKAIYFCRKYNNTELFEDICFNYIPEIKDKILFLSFANRLEGIDSLKDILDKSLDELKNTVNDSSSFNDVKEDVRAFGKNDFICLNFEREIIIIYSDGTMDERQVTESHDQILQELILENGYNYEGPIIFRNMVLTLAGFGNTVLLIEGDNVICTIPNNFRSIQKQKLKELFGKMNEESQISLCMANDGELYSLNNGDSMSSELAFSELSRVRSIN